MVFSSAVFLIFFLPIVLIGYYLPFRKSRKYKNIFLFGASVLFYAYGEPIYVLLLLFSVVFNWLLGRMIGKEDVTERAKKVSLAAGVFVNLFILFIFKYLNFALANLSLLFLKHLPQTSIILPIGISFYTFQAISYLTDVYRGKAGVQKNVLDVGLYIALFPQLIAGPIVRYDTIAKEIKERRENIEDVYAGIHRFIIGLGKKVLLADRLSLLTDRAWSLPAGELSMAMAWLGGIAYTLQIFFDFSGYSDMAIGLGRIFGFHFLENFNYPYISKSLTEFWRRWHISLGSWFRDYVYIPLGGNRKGKARQIRNLLIVWTLTGLWHGANWTFVLWGIVQFLVLLAEKLSGYAGKEKSAGRLYTIPLIIVGWVIFRSDSVVGAGRYLWAMVGGNGVLLDSMAVRYGVSFLIYLLAGIWFCIPHKKMRTWLQKRLPGNVDVLLAEVVYLAVLVISFAFIIRASYSPFIYFNF